MACKEVFGYLNGMQDPLHNLCFCVIIKKLYGMGLYWKKAWILEILKMSRVLFLFVLAGSFNSS